MADVDRASHRVERDAAAARSGFVQRKSKEFTAGKIRTP
jgi:hypothetical protein